MAYRQPIYHLIHIIIRAFLHVCYHSSLEDMSLFDATDLLLLDKHTIHLESSLYIDFYSVFYKKFQIVEATQRAIRRQLYSY
jgi:hypothetical protein